ncbi:MAG: acyl-CoA dehydrogenase family protein [Candidatus Rokubacteria bacterium]|nr:acyl-CoA dehydrogenase family protein [Candidatus Rokubacteria bacterium]MBI2555288.1 acyl-CoA dehydrogenase family protein [Candidatus Rokubacteria bacterium]
MSYPLSSEQKALKARARELAETFRGRAPRWDQTEEYPWENVKDLVEAGFMGMTVPKAYGGAERTIFDTVLVIEEVAKACGISGRIVVDANLGVVSAVVHYATDAQKRRWLPKVVEGDKPAICITEPEAGTAATDMAATAVRKGDRWILNGTKRWITGAGISHLHLVFCRLVEAGGDLGIGALVVERGAPGFTLGPRIPTLGLRGIPEGMLIFKNCEVPADNLVVGKDGFGKLMAAYNAQRLGAATVALGIAQGAYEEALAFSKTRRQFGREICEFQGIQWMLADMILKLEASRLLIHRAAVNAGDGLPDKFEAALAKTFAAESAIEVTSQALQVFGGDGYSRELPLERMLRDVRMFTIGGGTVQAMRNLIAAEILGRRFTQRRG